MVNKLSLPATDNEVQTKINEVVDDINTNVVHKTGNETIGGTKTFTNGEVAIKMSRGSTAYTEIMTTKGDANYTRTGGFRNIENNNINESTMYVTNDNGSSIVGKISICRNTSSGALYTIAPTPTTSDNSDKIATTAFVKSQGYITSSDLIDKADTDLSNLSATGEAKFTTTETNAKNYADSLASNYATSAQGALADTAVQPADLAGYATQTWVDQQGYITGITSGDVTTALGYTPYDASNPNGYITPSALSPYALSASLATVATSGSYNDLLNKPTVDQTYDETSTSAQSGVAVASAISGKADTDLSNINNLGKILVSGLSMPSSKYDNLTLGVSGATYSAPANGWFVFARASSANNQFNSIINVSAGGLRCDSYATSSGKWATVFMPAKKGDTIQVEYNTSTDKLFRFIYAEGENV